MSDLDDILLRLRDAPVPAGLASLEQPVFEALAARTEARGQSIRPMAVAAVAALSIGVLGGVPGTPVEAAETGFALGEVPSLAPSALLAGG